MMQIEQYIGIGKGNSITGKELGLKLNKSERAIRKYVADARKRGNVILNLQNAEGYYIPTVEEIEDAIHQYKQERSRAMEILKGTTYLHKWIDDVRGGRIGI